VLARLGGFRYHFEGVRGKTSQIRELVEIIDNMFDSFQRVNQLSRGMLGQPKAKNGDRKQIRDINFL
jgi:hypothetical protein